MTIVDLTGAPLEANPKIITFDEPHHVLSKEQREAARAFGIDEKVYKEQLDKLTQDIVNPQIIDEEVETVSDQSIGFIKSEDTKQVKELIKKRWGFEPPRAGDAWLMIELYVRSEDATHILDPSTGKKSTIFISDKERTNDKYTSCVGLVVAMGPKAYRGILFEENWYEKLFRTVFGRWMRPCPKQPTCSLGDWVVFPRNEGSFQNYRGKPICMVPDDRIFYPVANPEYVTRN